LSVEIDFVFLLKAIKDQKPLDIELREGNRSWNYVSRFLKLDNNHKNMIIDLPYTPVDTYRPLKEGERIMVAFNMAGFRFKFYTAVVGQSEYQVKPDIKTPALVIDWPSDIKDSNRRSLYRIRVSIKEPIKLQLYVDGDKLKELPLRDSIMVEAIIIDISKNGMAIETNKPCHLNIGETIKMQFQLPGHRKIYSLKGVVVYTSLVEEKAATLCGVQFLSGRGPMYAEMLKQVIMYTMAENQDQIDFFAVKQVVSRNRLVNKIVDGEVTDELLEMLINREFPLNDQEYLESLVHIIHYPVYKEAAEKMVQEIPYESRFEYIQKLDASHRVAYHLLSKALETEDLKMVQAALSNQFLPIEFTLKIAREGNDIMIHNLLAHKERLVIYPEVLEVLKKNPNISTDMTNQVILMEKEMQLGLRSKPISAKRIIEDLKREIEERRALKKAPIRDRDKERIKSETLERLKQINSLSIQERIKLALTGSSKERMILARDPSRYVMMALVESPKTGIDEALILLQNTALTAPIINKLMQNPLWKDIPKIIQACLINPHTPEKLAKALLKKLSKEEIAAISREKITPLLHTMIREHLPGLKKKK
jgi:hypothetical protein